MQLLRKARIVLAFLIVTSLAISACQPEVVEVVKEVPVEKVVEVEKIVEVEAPKGGKLKFTVPVEPDLLDPSVSSSRYDAVVISALYDALVFRNNDGDYVPWLAESWDVSADGLVWTFQLRNDVTFHDGTPFNAEAVKFNFDRAVDPETKSQAAKGQLGACSDTQVLGEYEVQITCSAVHASFLERLSGAFLRQYSPTAVGAFGEDYGVNPVGSGPFIFQEWVPSSHIIVTPNPDYNWGPPGFHQGSPYLEEIYFHFIGEEVSRVAALRSGETDVILYTPAREVAKLASDEFKVKVNEVPGIARVDIINAAKAPTDELAVRQAILHGTDRQMIIDTIDGGVGQALHNVISPGVWGYDSSIESLYNTYDPDKAKALLEGAGWVDTDGDGIREKDGETLSLVNVHFPGRTPGVKALIQAQLREIGFEMELLEKANPDNMQFARAKGHNLEWMTWGSTDPSIMGNLFHSRHAGNAWNYAFYEDERLDEVLDLIDQTVDLDTRKALVQEAQKIIMEAALVLPLTIDINVVAMHPDIQDLSFGPSGFYDVYFYDTYLIE